MLNTDKKIVNAVRGGVKLADQKLNTLVRYIRKAVKNRGHIQEEDINAFFHAGYTKRNVLEINLIIALMTISNCTNHLAEIPLDEVFQSEKVEFETA